MNINDLQKNFLEDEIWILAFMGGFQRSNVYKNTKVTEIKRKELKDFIRSKISTLFESSYQEKTPSTNDHIENLLSVKRDIEKEFKEVEILSNGTINLGVVQKIFNLYLKYKWCLGHCPKPPHCPFDAIIIGELGALSGTKWTKMNDRQEYLNLVDLASTFSGNKNIAQWELKIFSDIRQSKGVKSTIDGKGTKARNY